MNEYMPIAHNWNRAGLILKRWEKLFDWHSLGLADLIQFRAEKGLKLYFYTQKQVYCDYDLQYGEYIRHLAECKQSGETPQTKSEFYKQFPGFDTLITKEPDCGEEQPIYHLIAQIEPSPIKHGAFDCMRVEEAGASFADYDKRDLNNNIELYRVAIKRCRRRLTGASYPLPMKAGYRLKLKDIYIYKDDLEAFERLTVTGQHNGEPNNKPLILEQRMPIFEKLADEKGGLEQITQYRKDEIWALLQAREPKLFDKGRDDFFKALNKKGIRFPHGRKDNSYIPIADK